MISIDRLRASDGPLQIDHRGSSFTLWVSQMRSHLGAAMDWEVHRADSDDLVVGYLELDAGSTLRAWSPVSLAHGLGTEVRSVHEALDELLGY